MSPVVVDMMHSIAELKKNAEEWRAEGFSETAEALDEVVELAERAVVAIIMRGLQC